MQPWTQDDLDDMRRGVKSTANRFYTAAHELQRKVLYLPDFCRAGSDWKIYCIFGHTVCREGKGWSAP